MCLVSLASDNGSLYSTFFRSSLYEYLEWLFNFCFVVSLSSIQPRLHYVGKKVISHTAVMLSIFDAVLHVMVISVSSSVQPASDYASRERQGLGITVDHVQGNVELLHSGFDPVLHAASTGMDLSRARKACCHDTNADESVASRSNCQRYALHTVVTIQKSLKLALKA